MVTGEMGVSETEGSDECGEILGTQGISLLYRKASILEGGQPGMQTFIHLFPQIITQDLLRANHSTRPSKDSREQKRQKKIPAFVEFVFSWEDRKTREISKIYSVLDN